MKIIKKLIYCGVVLIICLFSISCSSFKPSPVESNRENILTIVYPESSTELVGGQSFRITIILKDYEEMPIEGALVETQLFTPDGEEYGAVTCFDKKDGRYLSDHITLPLKNSQGVWKVTAWAIVENEEIAQENGEFISQNSYSERLHQLFGFWIELTDLFPYNVANADDPELKTYEYDNGGYVILANNLNSAEINNSFVMLDVHWRRTEFPKDEISAANYILELAGPHRITLDISANDLDVENGNFKGWSTWFVTGKWKPRNALGNPGQAAPIEWVIFHCPESEWLWTILITTNEMEYFDDLKMIRETFVCPYA